MNLRTADATQRPDNVYAVKTAKYSSGKLWIHKTFMKQVSFPLFVFPPPFFLLFCTITYYLLSLYFCFTLTACSQILHRICLNTFTTPKRPERASTAEAITCVHQDKIKPTQSDHTTATIPAVFAIPRNSNSEPKLVYTGCYTFPLLQGIIYYSDIYTVCK